MKHGSLFSGIGGFDLAAQWMGWENTFHCEINPFGQQVLNYYWPDAISYTDITKTDFTPHRGTVDIISGGFPCQPYSAAGKRLGKEDERHLWPQMLRAICEVSPRWIVGENVRGLTNWNGGLVFDEVQSDLEAAGYEVAPFLLPACGVNAPHRRDRIWFVAHATSRVNEGRLQVREGKKNATFRVNGFNGPTPHANDQECDGWGCSGERERETAEQGRDGIFGTASRSGEVGAIAYSTSKGQQEWQHFGEWQGAAENTGRMDNRPERLGNEWITPNPGGPGREEFNLPCLAARQGHRTGRNNAADENWRNFPTQPPLCSRNDGFPSRLAGITVSKHRNESIKAYGNAVVPQVVYQIFKAIQQYETL